MEKTVIYRGVRPTEAIIVRGLGPDELGEYWTPDLPTAEGYAERFGGGVFRMETAAGNLERTPKARPNHYRLRMEGLTPEDLETLEYRRMGRKDFRKVWKSKKKIQK